MISAADMKSRVLKRAEDDNDFRERLLADPKAAIAEVIGMSLPVGFHVAVHEDSDTTAHLVLPPSARLTEEELKQVRSGADWVPTFGPA